jgi:hypothetical protein
MEFPQLMLLPGRKVCSQRTASSGLNRRGPTLGGYWTARSSTLATKRILYAGLLCADHLRPAHGRVGIGKPIPPRDNKKGHYMKTPDRTIYQRSLFPRAEDSHPEPLHTMRLPNGLSPGNTLQGRRRCLGPEPKIHKNQVALLTKVEIRFGVN